NSVVREDKSKTTTGSPGKAPRSACGVTTSASASRADSRLTMTAAPIDPRTFRHVLGQFCTGITIITTVHDDVPVGFACQSFAALSLDPPLVLFCPPKVSRSWKAIGARGKFCVKRLTERQVE